MLRLDSSSTRSAILEGWLVPQLVLLEVVWAARKLGLSAGEAGDVVEAIAKSPKARGVAHELGDLTGALRLLEDKGLSLTRFNDKVILLTAERVGRPPATFDSQLARRR